MGGNTAPKILVSSRPRPRNGYVPTGLALASVLLGGVAILLAVGGVFAFMHLRQIARKEARKVAKIIAAEVSERTANNYLQAELPAIISAHEELARNAATYTEGDEIADSEGGEK